MSQTLDQIMERASEALVCLDYLSCEDLCVQALAQARQAQQWDYYARILLPLQEARRQRRMIATDHGAWLSCTGAHARQADPAMADGCWVLTHPCTVEDAKALRDHGRANRRCIEVLLADNAIRAGSPWTIRSYAGPTVKCRVDGPNRLKDHPSPPSSVEMDSRPIDVGWYLHASESLGDAAIAQANQYEQAPVGSVERVRILEQMLQVVDDHEKLHQRLTEAAAAIGV